MPQHPAHVPPAAVVEYVRVFEQVLQPEHDSLRQQSAEVAREIDAIEVLARAVDTTQGPIVLTYATA